MYSPNTLSYRSSIPSTQGGITAARCIIDACYSALFAFNIYVRIKYVGIKQHKSINML